MRCASLGSARSSSSLPPTVGVNEVCLTCHGTVEEVDPEIRRTLYERYPDDQATGFSTGGLRGAFSVRVRLEDPSDR